MAYDGFIWLKMWPTLASDAAYDGFICLKMWLTSASDAV